MPSNTKPDPLTGDTTESAGEVAQSSSAVNRKKAKRRAKEAAKRQQSSSHPIHHQSPPPPPTTNLATANGSLTPPKQGRPPVKGYFTEDPDLVDPASPEDAFFSGDDDPNYAQSSHGLPDSSWLNTTKRKKSKSTPTSRSSTALPKPQIPPLSNAAIRASHKLSSDQIWNTSTQAERENIKQFWLELGEDERRSLVKVEKEAVLRKMKEQQKHSCSCSVCGRKRTAIEEELEVLYDAYYEELEQFANHNGDISQAPQLMAPPRPAFSRVAQPMAGTYPSRGRVHEIDQDEDDLDDEDDDYDDDDDEPYSEDDADFHHGLPPGPPDFFQFGNSLTVKDGILTVADDLLKNDGKHFIDMMEQLAERRMQRHNHPPLDDDDDYDDEEDDEDYDSQEDDFEGDEMDSMTEEQRMEEGRRMFQIFAARMFEQRVLTAYREKVAAERQRKLLEELDEESRLDSQRQDKKAREAAKRKEKKRVQKLAKEEEKSKKDAEKAAQEQALRDAEEKKLEEQRQRKEEQRKKREAEKKAAEEDRLRKEADKLRRQQEQRERQAEAERKQREAKERERLKRDEAKRKERELREAKEKEVRDRKVKEEKDKKAKENQLRKERESNQKNDKDSRHPPNHQPPPRNQPVALPPGLIPQPKSSSTQSPLSQVATPIVPPKTITPAARNRQASQTAQHSHGSSPRSQKASTETPASSASPATVAVPHTPGPPQPVKTHSHPLVLHHPQPSAPRSPLNNQGRGQQFPFNSMNGLPGLGVSGPPMGGNGLPNMMPPMPMYQGPPIPNHQRFAPNGMQYPPGFPRPFPGHQVPFVPQPNHGPMPAPPNVPQPPSHSRQPSSDASSQPAPIARPGPIARPSSTTPDKQKLQRLSSDAEVDQLTTQLGSKALLDDSDDSFLGNGLEPRMGQPPLGPPGSSRLPFASFSDHKQDAFGGLGNPGWAGFTPGMPPNASNWGPPPNQRPSATWSQPPFGAIGGGPQALPRSHLPRPILLRLNLVQACRQLSSAPGAPSSGFHPVQSVLRQLNANLLKDPNEVPVSMEDMLLYCDTEGNTQNGGGSFDIVVDPSRGQAVRFVDDATNQAGSRNSAGDIGSPMSRF